MLFSSLSRVLSIVVCVFALATRAGAYAVNPETFDGYASVADWSDSALYGWVKARDCNAAGRGEIGDFGQQGGKALRLRGAWPFGYVWQCYPSKVKDPNQTLRFEFMLGKGVDKNILAVGTLTIWSDQTAFVSFNAENGVVSSARFTRLKPGGAPSDQEIVDLPGKETMAVGEWYRAELDLDFHADRVRARFGPAAGEFFAWTPWAPMRDVRQPSGVLVQGLNVDIDSIGIPGAPVMPVDRPVKGWKNSLRPRGKPGPLLTLASAGRTAYRIVIAATASSQEEKAAGDLATWLRAMTDADFRIVREGIDFKPSGKEISIGGTQVRRAASLAGDDVDLKREGYAIAVKGDALFLWGGSARGPINAVYALLEEDLGCRWYAAKTATIPHRPNLAFRPVPRRFIPTLEIRDPGYLETRDADWQVENRVVSSLFPVVPFQWGGNADYAMFVHTYFPLLPPDRHFKAHPEYYSMLSGERRQSQVCATSPEVAGLMSKRVREILRQAPNSWLISVSPNDGTGYCECQTCKALDDAEGTKAASMLILVNRVADAIKDEFPHVRVSTLAYLDTVAPPQTIRPRPNVAIQFCTDAHGWPHPYLFVTQTPKVFDALKGWNKIGADIHIWDYTCSYGHYLTIMPNMPVVSENMKTYRQYGAKGILLQGAYNGFSENALLRSWVWAKQLWDPTLDTRALIKDFCYGYYGEAGEPMWAYNQLVWELWESNYARTVKDGHDGSFSGKTGKEPGADFLTKDFRQSAAKLFDAAERLAVNPEILRRVKYDKVPLLYVRISKELGYQSSPTVFFIGDAYKRGAKPGELDECRRMIDELEEITRRENISAWDENGFQSRDKTIPAWRNSFDLKVEPSTAVRLGDAWGFKLDPRDEGVGAGWYKPEVGFDTWSEIRSDWNGGWEQQGYGDYYGVAWYAQKVGIPSELAGAKHLYLMLRSPGGEATIFLNGVKACERNAATGANPWTNWALPLAFDAAGLLKPGEENLIVVRINRPRVDYPSYMRGVWGQTYVTATDRDLSPDGDPSDTEKLWQKLWLSTQANVAEQP